MQLCGVGPHDEMFQVAPERQETMQVHRRKLILPDAIERKRAKRRQDGNCNSIPILFPIFYVSSRHFHCFTYMKRLLYYGINLQISIKCSSIRLVLFAFDRQHLPYHHEPSYNARCIYGEHHIQIVSFGILVLTMLTYKVNNHVFYLVDGKALCGHIKETRSIEV